jgi:hypothetical protein
MPAFNNAVPQLPKRFDLRDVVDHVDRLLEVLDQAVVQSEGQIFPLTVDPATGVNYTSTNLPRPGFITSGTGITAYEAVLTQSTVAAASAANTGYGVKELLAVIAAKLATIPNLS